MDSVLFNHSSSQLLIILTYKNLIINTLQHFLAHENFLWVQNVFIFIFIYWTDSGKWVHNEV